MREANTLLRLVNNHHHFSRPRGGKVCTKSLYLQRNYVVLCFYVKRDRRLYPDNILYHSDSEFSISL